MYRLFIRKSTLPIGMKQKNCLHLQEKKLSNKNAVLRILLSLANKQCIADTIYSFVNVLKILPSLLVDQREAKKGKGRSYLYYLYLKGGGGVDLGRLFTITAEYTFKQKLQPQKISPNIQLC
jgi:hypothetical protein